MTIEWGDSPMKVRFTAAEQELLCAWGNLSEARKIFDTIAADMTETERRVLERTKENLDYLIDRARIRMKG